MSPEELLVQIHQKIIAFRDKKGFGDNEFAENAGLSSTAFIHIETVKKTGKGKIRTIDLLTLLKIFNKYEELKAEVLEYLSENTEQKKEKVTGGIKAVSSLEAERKALKDQLYEEMKANQDIAAKKIADLEGRLSHLEKRL